QLSSAFQRLFVVPELVDQFFAKRLFAGINAPVGELFDSLARQVLAPVGDSADELFVHLVDQALQILTLLGRDLAGGRAYILELAALEDFGAQLRPLQQVAVVHPFGNHANRAGDSPGIRVDFVRRTRDVVAARRAHRTHRNHDLFPFFVAKPFELIGDLLGSRNASARRVHSQQYGFDARIVAISLQALVDRLRIEDDSFKIHDGDSVAAQTYEPALARKEQRGKQDYRDEKHESEAGYDQNRDDAEFLHKSSSHKTTTRPGAQGPGRVHEIRCPISFSLS